MNVTELSIPEVKLIQLKLLPDDRGAFAETYDRAAFEELGIDVEFVQDSWSLSLRPFTVRGLHFQVPPRAQAKLVRVGRGRVFDVVVDLRHGSPTFGTHLSLEMAADDWQVLLVPEGLAHGFCSLEPATEVLYKMSDHFSPEHYQGIAWDDPELGIPWPVSRDEAIVSERDSGHPSFRELPPLFRTANS